VLSLAGYLRAIEGDLPPELITREAARRMIGVAESLPPLPMIGFEARLGGGDQASHFFAAVRAAQGDREILMPWLRRRKADAKLGPPGSPWNRIHAFCAEWLDPSSILHTPITSLWLEYDVDGAEQPPPNVFFGIASDELPLEKTRLVLIERAAFVLAGRPLDAAVRDSIDRVLAAVPEGCHLFQMGMMMARPTGAVRLCVMPPVVSLIPELLAAVGWPGDVGEVTDFLSALPARPQSIGVNLDVGAEVLPRTGLECYLDERRHPRLDPAWEQFLDYLVGRALCTPERKDALLGWPGQGTVRFLWTSTIIRLLNHIKIDFTPGRPTAAKGYFGFVQAAG
jgi:hypothetical protein